MADDIKTLLEQLNEILNQQVTASNDDEIIRLQEEDFRLTTEIQKLLESQNLNLDQIKKDFSDIENLGTIVKNLRRQDQTNPAVPIDTRGIFKRFADMFKKSEPAVVGHAAADEEAQQEQFKTEINDLTNIIKSLNENIQVETDEEVKAEMGKQLEDNITKLIELFASNERMTNNFLNETGQTLKDFFNGSLDNMDYFKSILEEHEEELRAERERRQKEYEDSIDYFKSSTKNLFDTTIDTFKGHFNDVFGELYDTFITPLMSIGGSLINFGKSAFGLTKKPSEEQMVDHLGAIKTTLSNIYEGDKARDKRDARNVEGDDKKFPWLDYLGMAVMGLGAVIGGLTRRFTMFFEIFQVQKFAPVKKVIEFFGKIGSTVGGWIDDAIKSVSKIPVVGKFVSEVMEQFMKFFPAVAKGFRVLGLPLTILLGAIDFIKGFMGTEGNILDKIKGGLQSAVEGFIDIPVWLFGKLGDYVLGWFGTEIEGGMGSKIKEGILGITGAVIDYFLMIPNMVSSFFTEFMESEESGFFGKLKDGLLGAIGTLIEWPTKLIGSIGDEVLGWFGTEIEGGVGPKIKEIMLGMFGSIVDGIYTISGAIIDGILLIPKMVSSFFTGVFQSEDLGLLSLKDGIISAFNTFKDGIVDIIGNVFNWVDSLFDWSKLKDTIVNKIKNIPGAGLFFKSDNEKEETIKTISGGRGRTPGTTIERGIRDDSEKGGPISSMPSPSGISGSMMILSEIKYILSDKLNTIIQILSGSSGTVMSGLKNVASGIGNAMSSLFKRDQSTDVKDVVGVGTEMSEVPGSTGEGWEDPMGTGKRITSEYGARIHPVTGKMQGHKGLDMAGPEPGMYGYPIKASKDGIVSIARSLRGYGNVIYMDHEGGYQTRYAHLNSFKVKPGDMVAAGDVIGGMGNTGVGTGPHLHYEIRKDDRPLNPMSILSAKDGAMIEGNTETEFAAKVHPDEAILPLNDDVLTKLGEKIGQFVNLPSTSASNIDKYIKDLINIIRTSTSAQETNHVKFLNSLKEIMSDKENRQTIVNNMSNRSSNFKEDIPDQIENSMMMLMNSSWGV